MTSKHILFVFNKLNNDQGGLITATLPLIRILVEQRNIKVSIICHQFNQELVNQYLPNNILIHKFPSHFVPSYQISLPAKTWLKQHIKQYDLVHIHGIYYYLSDMAQSVALRSKTPYIISFHGMLDAYSLHHKWFKKKVYHWLFNNKEKYAKAQYLQALSDREKQNIEVFLTDNLVNNRIFTLANGVDIKTFKPLINNHKNNHKNSLQFLFAGRIDQVKQYQLVIQAFKAFNQKQQYKHQLIIAGSADSENLEILNRLLVSNSHSNTIRYVGTLSQNTLVPLMQASDVFINASKSEAFSMAVCEAMACGCACIIANNKSFGHDEYDAIHLLDHPISVNDLEAAMSHVTNNDTYRHKLSDNAVRYISQHYAVDDIACSLCYFYDC